MHFSVNSLRHNNKFQNIYCWFTKCLNIHSILQTQSRRINFTQLKSHTTQTTRSKLWSKSRALLPPASLSYFMNSKKKNKKGGKHILSIPNNKLSDKSIGFYRRTSKENIFGHFIKSNKKIVVVTSVVRKGEKFANCYNLLDQTFHESFFTIKLLLDLNRLSQGSLKPQ